MSACKTGWMGSSVISWEATGKHWVECWVTLLACEACCLDSSVPFLHFTYPVSEPLWFGLEHVDFKLPVGLQEEVSGRQPAVCIWGWRGLPGSRASPFCQAASLGCWGALEQAWGHLLICPMGTASPAFEFRTEWDTHAVLSAVPAWRGMAACS